MITVVIPTLNAEAGLPATLTALVPGVVAGLVREVVIVDGGSTDRTLAIADAAGAHVITVAPGRGSQLMAGAEIARGDWILFLHADTTLDHGWESEVATFMERVDTGRYPQAAAVFRFALDDIGVLPRVIEAGVGLRCLLLGLPYGDQGLLMPRMLYRELGGYRPLPLMEDVDIVRRLGRRRTIMLRTRALTSAARYRKSGYLSRVLRNWTCLTMYYVRVPPRVIARIYNS